MKKDGDKMLSMSTRVLSHPENILDGIKYPGWDKI